MKKETIEKLITRMEKRKYCTQNGIESLFEIFENLSGIINDDVTTYGDMNIPCEWEYSQNDYDSYAHLDLLVAVNKGEVGLYSAHGRDSDDWTSVEKDEVVYINLGKAALALEKFVEVVLNVKTNEKEAEKLENILACFDKSPEDK